MPHQVPQPTLESFTINPLVYDALSGGFIPESDPERTHTLGRLLVASFLKGTYSLDTPEPDEGVIVFSQSVYTPSWAKHVTVTTGCALIPRAEDDPLHHFFDAELIINSGNNEPTKLYVCDQSVGVIGGLLLTATNSRDYTLPLELGHDTNDVQLTVTQAARAFFGEPAVTKTGY